LVEPTLIHPVAVTIQQKDAVNTPFRSDAREPVRTMVRKADKALRAQVNWRNTNDPTATYEGISEECDGYLLFKLKELAAASVTLQRGDRITKIAGTTYELYITQLKPCGHYPDQGGPSMIKAFFATRNPT